MGHLLALGIARGGKDQIHVTCGAVGSKHHAVISLVAIWPRQGTSSGHQMPQTGLCWQRQCPGAALPFPTPEAGWCHAMPRHAKPRHIKQYHAVLCHAASQATPCHAGQAMVLVRSPEETKCRGSAGQRSPGLGGGISAVCVQSHQRLGPGALQQQEGAEQAG